MSEGGVPPCASSVSHKQEAEYVHLVIERHAKPDGNSGSSLTQKCWVVSYINQMASGICLRCQRDEASQPLS